MLDFCLPGIKVRSSHMQGKYSTAELHKAGFYDTEIDTYREYLFLMFWEIYILFSKEVRHSHQQLRKILFSQLLQQTVFVNTEYSHKYKLLSHCISDSHVHDNMW